MNKEMSKWFERYGERYSTATIYIAFVFVSLIVAAVLFGIFQTTAVMKIAFPTAADQAEFGGAFAGFLATLLLLIRSYSRVSHGGRRSLTGNVLTPEGTPVPNATVFVEGVDRQKVTDATGWFTIEVGDQESWVVRAVSGAKSCERSVKSGEAAAPIRLTLRGSDSAGELIVPWANLQPDYIEPFSAPNASPETLRQIFAGNLIVGREDCWQGALDGGVYRISNWSKPDAVQYFYIGLGGQGLSERLVAVDVKVDAINVTTDSGAGLLYRYDDERKFFYAFVLQNDRTVTFRKRNAHGYITLDSIRLPPGTPDGFVNLALVAKGDRFYLFVDRALIKTIKEDKLERGQPGFIAIGEGMFQFDNFAIYPDFKTPSH